MKKFSFLSLVLSFSLPVFAASPSQTSEAHFLDQMTAHHRDGVSMAKLAVRKSEQPEVKKLSQKMAEDQKKEIEQMEKWRQEKYSDVPPARWLPKKMDISKLENLSGKGFDEKYLEMMSRHHESGIDMFKEAKPNVSDEQIKSFISKGQEKQEKEAKKMDHMRKEL